MSCSYDKCVLDEKKFFDRKLIKNIISGLILMLIGIIGFNSLENIGMVFALGGEAFIGVGIVEYFYNKSSFKKEIDKRG